MPERFNSLIFPTNSHSLIVPQINKPQTKQQSVFLKKTSTGTAFLSPSNETKQVKNRL